MKTAYLIILGLLLCALELSAQPNNPTNPVPLDGGLSFLVVGASAFAAYQLKKKQKQDN